MNIEIWSDIMCPFCYIGKAHLNQALSQFEHRAEVDIVWRSFLLRPDLQYVPGRTLNDMLASSKGWSAEQTRQAQQHIVGMAASAGLIFNVDDAIPANTIDAHRLLHAARMAGLQDRLGEALFRAYWTQGLNVGDHAVLSALASDAGLSKSEIDAVLATDRHLDDVEQDIAMGQSLGVRGVPFFVIDRAYAISGAQPAEGILQALETAWAAHSSVTEASAEGPTCDDDACAIP